MARGRDPDKALHDSSDVSLWRRRWLEPVSVRCERASSEDLMRRPLLLAAAIVIGFLFLQMFSTESAPRAGSPAGDVRAELSDGGLFRLGDERGRVVVVNFWATWCMPCRHEIPVLNALHARGVRIVGLAVDALPLADVGAQARGLGIRYPVGRAAPGVAERLEVRVVPSTYVVGRDGTLTLASSGVVSEAELDAAVAVAKER
jgi:thiol-disulfide isomerase/thioredoxin